MAETHQQAGSFEALLNESRDLVCERLRAALGGMLEKSDESLNAMSAATQNREAQELYHQTRKLLVAERRKLETEFHKYFLSEFRKHASLVQDAAQSFSELDTSLSLVGEEDLEETLKFKELAAKLRRFCDDELAALDQRVGVLLGDANLAAENNPFGPETICEAYQQACHALDTNAKVRGVLLKLFDDYVVDEVRSIYKEVNALLVKNSILPKIRYGVSKKAGGKHAAGAHDEEAEEKEAEERGAAPGEQDLFSLLQNLVGGTGGGAGAGPVPPGTVVRQGAELLGALTRIQQGDASVVPGGLSTAAATGTVNVLHELKASSFGAGLVQMDATTLDIVAMLFDQLFDDPNIPVGLKGLIGRLQIPMLKVAIADKSFFARKSHPARQLLDSFGEVASRLPTGFNTESPEFVHLEAIIQHLLDNFQDDVALFDTAREQVLAVASQHDERIEQEARAVAQRIEQSENLSVAKTAAEDELKVRLQTHQLPGLVLEFLVEHWLKLMLLVHARHGRHSDPWKQAIQVMDELIWSVEPKSTLEERRKLAAAVPGVVKHLVAGLDALGVGAEVRGPFFAELMKCHTEALSAPKAKGKAGPEPAAAPKDAKPAATLDFTAPVTVKNPYGAGVVEVTGLDFVAQPVDEGKRNEAKAALRSSLAVPPPENMEIGTWVEFRPKEGSEEQRVTKLLFVSPKKTRYLFSDRRGKNILELTRGEIVRRLRTGEAMRLDAEPRQPLFDRFMSGVVDKLRSAPKPA